MLLCVLNFLESKMNADFDQKLEAIRQGKIEVLKIAFKDIGDDGARALSMA